MLNSFQHPFKIPKQVRDDEQGNIGHNKFVHAKGAKLRQGRNKPNHLCDHGVNHSLYKGNKTMDVTPLISRQSNVIQAYGTDGFKISGDFYGGNVIVTIDQIVGWTVADFESLHEDSFSQILPIKDVLDVIFIGTGKTFRMPPRALRDAWRAQGLRIEPMDTGAACRTYNVLMADGRRVAAALLSV